MSSFHICYSKIIHFLFRMRDVGITDAIYKKHYLHYGINPKEPEKEQKLVANNITSSRGWGLGWIGVQEL